MVTFTHPTPSDIENLIQSLRDKRKDKIADAEELVATAPDALKVAATKRLEWLRSDDYTESKEAEFRTLREDLAHEPVSRLRMFLDYLMPEARKSWHDRDEYWYEEFEMLPFLAEIDTLLSFGEIEQAFLHMRDNWVGCYGEMLDVTAPCWMDVKFAS